jgi:hypothetical protein
MVAQTPSSTLGVPRPVSVDAIREVDRQIGSLPPAEGEVVNTFTPGIMTRRWFGAAGTRHRSKIHNTKHQYVVIQGACLVSENGGPTVMVVAPFHGITEPGTWRDLFVIMDCVWLTMHPTDKTTVEEVEKDIIQPLEELK